MFAQVKFAVNVFKKQHTSNKELLIVRIYIYHSDDVILQHILVYM